MHQIVLNENKTITNKQARFAKLDIIGPKIVENLSSKWGPIHKLTYVPNYYLLFIMLTESNNQFRNYGSEFSHVF